MDIFLDVRATKDAVIRGGIAIFQFSITFTMHQVLL